MRFEIHCHRLLEAMQLCSAAVSPRSPKPILTNIKAEATSDGQVRLSATDMEVGITTGIGDVSVTDAGSVILPAKRLISILRETPTDQVVIDGNADVVNVTSSSAAYEMPSEDPAAFPDVPHEAVKSVSVKAGDLKRAIELTGFAVARQDTKYSITGLLFEVEGQTMRVVGTDTRRLANMSVKLIDKAEAKAQMLVPDKAADLLQKCSATDSDEAVKVSFNDNMIIFETAGANIYSRLLEGRYPPYKDIIPKKSKIKVTVATDDILRAVRQAAILTDDESKRVSFNLSKGNLILRAETKSGKSHVDMKIEYDDADMSFAVDPSYVIDMLKVAKSPTVDMLINEPNKPILFTIGEEYKYLVMPLS